MDAEFEDDDTYGGDQLIPGAARSNLRNAGAKDDASIVILYITDSLKFGKIKIQGIFLLFFK